jgi:hypothetical protein
MEKLKFYDVKGKKSFSTAAYTPMMKSGRKFAVATAPSGAKAYRIMAKK